MCLNKPQSNNSQFVVDTMSLTKFEHSNKYINIVTLLYSYNRMNSHRGLELLIKLELPPVYNRAPTCR